MSFTVSNPDYSRSPYTGLTRSHWRECARFMLQGAFSHLESADQPLVFPKVPGKTYPHSSDPDWRSRAMEFEGLIRTFYIAAPLLQENPNEEVSGIRLRDYYSQHLLASVTPGTREYFPPMKDLPSAPKQMTCEWGGLALYLMVNPDSLWPVFSKAEQDRIAHMMSEWAHGTTCPHNWRYFNVMMLTFLKLQGYPIDEDLLADHHDFLLSCYGGQGWYQDNHFDFYSVWVFQLYGVLWNYAYGYKHDPERAQVIERRFRDFITTYPAFFGRDGQMLMWGRSICYRLGAVCAFALPDFLPGERALDAGYARRIASGTLLQFVKRPEFWHNNLPALGFYGHFEPALQSYSCAASPFWLALSFIGLSLPECSPYWTATENEGEWSKLGRSSRTQSLPGPGFNLTQHGSTGVAELRPAKLEHDDSNYSRLVYNTHFPWQEVAPEGWTSGTFNALWTRQTYPALPPDPLSPPEPPAEWVRPQQILWVGEKNGVLLRTVDFKNSSFSQAIDIAEIALSEGMVLQIARTRLPFPHVLRLTHLALPVDNEDEGAIHYFQNSPNSAQNNSHGNTPPQQAVTVYGSDRKLALVALWGWDTVECKRFSGLHPEKPHSLIPAARLTRPDKLQPVRILATLFLHGTDTTPWTEEQLFKSVEISWQHWSPSGSLWGATVRTSEHEWQIDFGDITGNFSC